MLEDMTAMTTENDVSLTVGQAAEQTGVTVRTLHHYDEIGLLRPSGRTASGYRLYTAADLERMQQIVVYRRLGFSLEEVAELLADSDAVAHLQRQRQTVMARMAELGDLVESIDRALEAEMSGTTLTAAERRELFGESFDEEQREAQERWGDTAQWKQSAARTKRYTKEDWERLKAEQRGIFDRIVATFRSGAAPERTEAMDAVEEHRVFIDRWFYDCPREFQVKLGELYVADPRYGEGIAGEALEGLGNWIRDAIVANAAREG
ncbi:MerR family transcriptional regulator [Actinotalea caeni]